MVFRRLWRMRRAEFMMHSVQIVHELEIKIRSGRRLVYMFDLLMAWVEKVGVQTIRDWGLEIWILVDFYYLNPNPILRQRSMILF